MSEFLTFSKYHSQEEAAFMISLLKEAGIAYELEKEVNNLDPIYIGYSLDPLLSLRIPQDKFEQVNQLLSLQAQLNTGESEESYYLNSYDDKQLLGLLQNPNDFSAYELIYAKKLLVALPSFASIPHHFLQT